VVGSLNGKESTRQKACAAHSRLGANRHHVAVSVSIAVISSGIIISSAAAAAAAEESSKPR